MFNGATGIREATGFRFVDMPVVLRLLSIRSRSSLVDILGEDICASVECRGEHRAAARDAGPADSAGWFLIHHAIDATRFSLSFAKTRRAAITSISFMIYGTTSSKRRCEPTGICRALKSRILRICEFAVGDKTGTRFFPRFCKLLAVKRVRNGGEGGILARVNCRLLSLSVVCILH